MGIDSGKNIAILGAATSGIAAARLAIAGGAAWVGVFDSAEAGALSAAEAAIREIGAEVRFGEAALRPPGELDLVVVSPGVPLASDLGNVFADTGAELIGEIEYAYQRCGKPVIAITGTNGKTTTTELTAAILNAGGQRTVAAGNVGKAFSQVVADGGDFDVITLEVSSFQLETIATFRAAVAVWLNFAPDHLNRHGGVEAYRRAKLRVFENQAAGDVAVVNAADAPPIPLAADTVTFSASRDDADFTLENGSIRFRGEEVFDFRTARLEGHHNAENVMAAMASAYRRGVPFEAMAGTIANFQASPHRCEPVGEVGGVNFVNDSKATNPHAVESALRGREDLVVLIAGGEDKKLDFEELSGTIATTVSHVVAIGEIADQICEIWSSVVPCETAATMAEAVAKAASRAKPGQTVLLGPGTSSFDMFTDYRARGDAFREAVAALASR